MTEPDVLPPGVRLFHIGPQKTGTTALQASAAASRGALREHGVLYPGVAVNHRLPIAALMGKTIGWKTGEGQSPVPERFYWTRLVSEMQAHPDLRAWFGHEYGAGASIEVIREVHETFGDDLHVLITLRSLSRLLPSVWQETNKAAGNRGTFDRWLEKAFDEGSPVNEIVRTRHDQTALVRRWADIVGEDHVTVIVLDPTDHAFLHHTVERLLGLPQDLLAEVDAGLRAANRSLTVPEIELFRRFNKKLRAHDVTWAQYDTLAVRGAIARVLGHRRPPAHEARLTMPDWAADRADALSIRNAEGVAASGVRVIGDPHLLAQPAVRRHSDAEDHQSVTDVPVDLAVHAMLGLSASALGLTPAFEEPQNAAKWVNPLSRFTAKELATELYRRGRGKLQR
ncbi:MAG: hypothetical protein QM779_10610 [Propionicimonas sp.]|uniref:hypothetical protein n=1 Tax=Propionicimonas sp. TaxID=1955623 RepID=UPI003D105A62